MVGSYWVCHWKKTFWDGGCDGIWGLAYLLFCAAYWSRQPRVFRRLSRSCYNYNSALFSWFWFGTYTGLDSCRVCHTLRWLSLHFVLVLSRYNNVYPINHLICLRLLGCFECFTPICHNLMDHMGSCQQATCVWRIASAKVIKQH